jgi:hypothetical protein
VRGGRVQRRAPHAPLVPLERADPVPRLSVAQHRLPICWFLLCRGRRGDAHVSFFFLQSERKKGCRCACGAATPASFKQSLCACRAATAQARDLGYNRRSIYPTTAPLLLGIGGEERKGTETLFFAPLLELIRNTPSSVIWLYSRLTMGRECPWHTSGAAVAGACIVFRYYTPPVARFSYVNRRWTTCEPQRFEIYIEVVRAQPVFRSKLSARSGHFFLEMASVGTPPLFPRDGAVLAPLHKHQQRRAGVEWMCV